MHVEVRPLDREAAEGLLRRHHVGRIAFASHGRVTIQLVNYVFADGWIYARMEAGEGVATLHHNGWAAFEVDEIDGVFEWRTASVRGSVHFLTDADAPSPAAPDARRAYTQAVRLLRSAVPALFTVADPLPERAHLYRLHVDEIVGFVAHGDVTTALPSA